MSNTQKKNVPELRFPGFEGEWEEKQFADFTKINQGLQIAINERKTEYSPELYFYITNEFLRPNSQTKYFIENPPQSVIANKEDILMTRTGNTGKVVTNVFGAFHNNFFKIKFDKNLYDRLFLVEVLNSSKIQNKILSLAGSSTIPDLNHSDFYSISSSYPLLREQQKIGKFFSKLDRQIELEEQKLELLKQQKKGYMQKIFSQELRFKDENGNDYPDWENVMLQKVLKDKTEGIKRGPFGGALKKDIFVESGYAVYEQRNAIYDISNFRYYIDENKYNEMLSFSVQPNDIIMSCSGTIGRLSLIPQNFTKGIINQALIRFRTNHKIRSEFFLIFMRSNQMQRKILEANPGSAITNLVPVKELKLIPFPLPVKFEQDKISQFILIINRRIEQSEKKIESLKNRKQGFLQKLFI
ncbi:TPA: restriction endonuclease subunit S [Staphylococcus aureus]|uniref:restriction endonuclease subunit S n=9 Tax=Staphylococcus TaxID=1279 RepID=UPI001C1F1329|nr:restriction endonuclease subunit S [Staphylococcus aureus]MBU7293078.1 restriction endonuclease subunit S [Staphylococcus aureus]HCY9466152.1 restriction endonuclease subunit S [Staphylococcus aureus]HDH5896236.1 restriction endonuclease subunit S [Staphylococcus aureus]